MTSFWQKLENRNKRAKKRNAKERKQNLKADPYYYKKQHLASVNREKLRQCLIMNHPTKKKNEACKKKYGPQVAARLGRHQMPNNNPSTRGKQMKTHK